ncbi:PAS domain-containing sensor histidine kinase [Parabacteroides sp. 52]|uniref:sensor histidine kinase n=2 Tax=unclassified Parabacteroides TaxID=2649774 RepID=UPI0013CF41E2|nr:PAS domain-containing sensor histidine kinase [Parabacteroides sp. 52]
MNYFICHKSLLLMILSCDNVALTPLLQINDLWTHRLPVVPCFIVIGLFVFLFSLMMIRLYRKESYNKDIVQKKLEKEQKELDITINSLKEGVVSVDVKGNILSINSAAICFLRLDKKKSYIGTSIWSLFDIQEKGNPFYLKEQIHAFSNSLGNQTLSDTAYVITKNKNTFSVAGSISSLYYNGRSYGSVITFHDTTDEFTQKEFLALSMISGDVFAWHYNPGQNALFFDPSFFEAFHIDDDGTHAIKGDRFLNAIHPDDLDDWLNMTRDVFHGKIKKITKQVRMMLSGSAYQWWEYRLAVLPKSHKGSKYKLIGICMSIEQFKKTEEELIRLRDEAEKSDQMKGVFLANMSHEVRTPLNAIVGFSSLLIDSQDLSLDIQVEFMDIVNENCRLLLKLINEILDISRIESGITFTYEVVNLNTLIEEIILQVMIEQQIDKVELVCKLPDEPLSIVTDPFRLKQVLGNLIDNALKFTQKGTICMGYSYKKTEKEVVLFVEDDGMGISAQELPKIFERFYKSDNFTQGGGLGLPIAEEIVKRLNGRIHVESELGKGTCFFVYLPWDKEEGLKIKEESGTNET